MASPYHTYDAECSSGGGQLHGEKAALGEQGQRKRHEGAPGQLLLQKPSLGLLLMFKLAPPVSPSTSWLIPSYLLHNLGNRWPSWLSLLVVSQASPF